MDFPAYVPAAVRAHVLTLIEGDAREPVGWAASLAFAEESLARINRAIEGYLRRGEDDYLPSLRAQKAEALAHRDAIAGDLDCLRRLAHDGRMADAYALLTREFTDDQQWRGFIRAAWSARIDFAKHRDRLRRAAELKDDIADAAERLARLIREFSEKDANGPGELYSIPELLRRTDNHEMRGHNLHMWRAMRRHVLGDPSGTDSDDQARDSLRYAWGTAPGVPELLDTMASAARGFKPGESGMIGAALESRQQSPKAEYLRAFASLLTDVHGFILNPRLMRAMAVVATVVINSPDIDVSYDDVRKRLPS
jgi:hypothetical protein